MYCLVNIPKYILDEKYIKYRPLDQMGENTGNCLFWESTKEILRKQNLNLLSIHEYDKNPLLYKDKISKVVISSANLIGNYDPKYSDKYWIHNLKKWSKKLLETLNSLECKKYIISIGAQSHDLKLFKLEEGQKRIFKQIFSQCEVVYLRGCYTYDLLKYNKILFQNTSCVGCPSLLLRKINLDELKNKINNITITDIEKIHVGISVDGMINRKDISSQFVSLMGDNTFHTLVQADKKWFEFIKNKTDYPPINPYFPFNPFKRFFLKKRILKNIKNFIYSDNYSDIVNYFKNNVDCIITTRIHGTILGTISGVPSLCLVTDSRTYELCEQMGIPYVNCIDKKISFKNKKELIKIFLENCKYDNKIYKTIEDMEQKYKVFSQQ